MIPIVQSTQENDSMQCSLFKWFFFLFHFIFIYISLSL